MNTCALALLQSQFQGPGEPLPTTILGDGIQWIRTLVTLVVVCLAAWWTLRWAARHGIGQAARGRNVRVLERVALDARRSVYLIEVGTKTLLLGASEQSLTMLTEVKHEDLTEYLADPTVPSAKNHGDIGFAKVLARIRSVAPKRHTQSVPKEPTNSS